MNKTIFALFVCLLFSFGLQAQEYSQENYQPQRQKGRHFLQLRNGQVVYGNRVQYKSPLFKQDFFLVDDTLKYAPELVDVYQNNDGYFARVAAGNRFDAFAKRIMEGPRISKFFTTTIDYAAMGYHPYGYGMPRTSRRRIYFFSKDNGPLMTFNQQNLEQALADNSSSMLLIQRHKREKTISTVMGIAGAGLLTYGLLSSSQSSTNPNSVNVSPAVYAGAGLIAVPLVIQLFRKDKLTQAVDVYNYQVRQ
ncbi:MULTISPECIES: hypothetical protein [Pontibacter]|uniref:Uncharacterized protein n=1 Tax=Pontibacter lucknowensis TaxID=1077936 RepID=A0A1N6UUI7_9BACT|nr:MULTISPECIES: hypothetical protein [Pontibacter]EJF09617.1 hypothetical protein O71_13936 [Pontibacter sp. BAB1700]SIQ69315.1 hypothetical protein SAMN05421545_1086 [Pontibacter lucknowensis]